MVPAVTARGHHKHLQGILLQYLLLCDLLRVHADNHQVSVELLLSEHA
jgi:hypothetical protein